MKILLKIIFNLKIVKFVFGYFNFVVERIVKMFKSNKATNLWRRGEGGGVGKKGGIKFLPLLGGYKK
jgi:hypothetical protein